MAGTDVQYQLSFLESGMGLVAIGNIHGRAGVGTRVSVLTGIGKRERVWEENASLCKSRVDKQRQEAD